ncbi:MAG: glucose-1-phosphate cytidylyltransferase [Propionivibrio sp.]|uniref:glucose-1-phosphate cytidylyltransferase n=1 Tax=Propionivibrio sp. TaxID=2212460 RepID=UPI001A496987|nr:glucose-1-phosphate cytidylyltransferase [Propionivibrio sp.]MBL8414915.1 glucose-1-phosphate cytidylyltransferase [Propionivibrio sp.]
MKTVLLAGGRGTRISEETEARPKPMIEIGGKPILWHIMKGYAHHGCTDFVVACGYKGELIKHYFLNFNLFHNDYRVNLSDGRRELLNASDIGWEVSVIDTGLDTLTGGRLLRLKQWLQNGTFMLTYGDGLSDVDIEALLAFHRAHGKIATVTAVRPPARFGALEIHEGRVDHFAEKPVTESGWINGGFFVFEPGIFNYLEGDHSTLEREPLEKLVGDGQLMAFTHEGFWQPMDTLRDKLSMEALWASGHAPWKKWS